MIARPGKLQYKIGKFAKWTDDVLKLDSGDLCYAKDAPEGQHTYLAIQFELEKSCYATMLMRELFHYSTDFKHQEAIIKIIKEKFQEEIPAKNAEEQEAGEEEDGDAALNPIDE
jgi:hypothetical protein